MALRMKALFFDFGRTIVQHPEDGVGLEIVKETGVENEEDARLIRDAVFSVAKYANFIDEGSMSRDTYKELLSKDVPERLVPYALKAADYPISRLPMIDGMRELLTKLRADGFKLYITSNLDEYHADQMPQTETAQYFDAMLFSSKIKVRKPYPEFFQAALQTFDVKAEDCLFIDDLEENVRAAEACGIKGLVFHGDPKEAEQFIYANL